MARSEIVRYYRKHDDFRRYLVSNRKRVNELSWLYRTNRAFFGQRILDLACGGGALGFVAEPQGHRYLGVDINRDMVDSARQKAKESGSRNRFVLRDVRSQKIAGVYDTITLLGNAVIHFDTADFLEILRNVERNSRVGTFLLVEYRDVVEMLFAGLWDKRHAESRGGKTIVSLAKGIDTERGQILIESVAGGRHNLDFTHAVWSPFIVGTLMESNGWQLVRRGRSASHSWLDVYKKSG